MSSKVVVTNNSNFCFKKSVIVFSENEIPTEKIWDSKTQVSILQMNETMVLGKLFHSDILPNGSNVVISIILSVKQNNRFDSHEAFIILKARIKSTKTGLKIYAYSSCYPENFSFTKPQWRKGTSKV